jgi:hypothetical protein
VLPLARIDRHALRHPGTGGQALANAAYLATARGLVRLIGRHRIVRSVYVRRSVAAGEVVFGRSDIDLTIVLHDACATMDGASRLYALNRTVRGIRRMFPWLGQCEVHAAGELGDWAERESFRTHLEIANAVLVHGEPVELPVGPIDQRQAAYRTAFWLEKYLPIALAGHRRDQLWKFVLEMWVTASLAVGRLAEPCLTRAETLRAWHRHPEPVAPPEPGQPVETLWRTALALLAEVHGALRTPVASPGALHVFTAVLPPGGPARTVWVGTVEQLARELGRSAKAPPSKTTLAFTPEALDLYLEYVNPAFHAQVSRALGAVGPVTESLQMPSAAAWHEALRRWSCPVLARKPGFGTTDFGMAPRQVGYARRVVETVAGGWPPSPEDVPPCDPASAPPPSFRDYFLRDYVSVYEDTRAIRRRLAGAPAFVTGPG